LNRLVPVANSTEYNLRIEVIRQLLDELRLNRELLVHHREVILQLLMVRNDDSLSERIVLGPSRTSEHLKDVLR
jgi:hypothetical protein